MGRLYGENRIATIKGGPIEEKIEAIEAFWTPDGAQILISTTAGGEGINLQVCHILFNYDLPCNPMALEQRIGRIHRYGQVDTSQVYNLVAEDTVEERIYALLEEKLLDIARTIGKVDTVTGEVLEDFRSEILGFLGSSPNYQELYKRALIDRDYTRTEKELTLAIKRAKEASEALRNLAQGLETFNLEHYRQLRGQFSMDDLRAFVQLGILTLEGSFLPDGETFRIETAKMLMEYPGVLARYQSATFNRELAMRRRKTELLGLGHPLVDALIHHLQAPSWKGGVSYLSSAAGNGGKVFSIRYLVTANIEKDHPKKFYYHCLIHSDNGGIKPADERMDLKIIQNIPAQPWRESDVLRNLETIKEMAESGLGDYQADLRGKVDGIESLRHELVGISILE